MNKNKDEIVIENGETPIVKVRYEYSPQLYTGAYTSCSVFIREEQHEEREDVLK